MSKEKELVLLRLLALDMDVGRQVAVSPIGVYDCRCYKRLEKDSFGAV